MVLLSSEKQQIMCEQIALNHFNLNTKDYIGRNSPTTQALTHRSSLWYNNTSNKSTSHYVTDPNRSKENGQIESDSISVWYRTNNNDDPSAGSPTETLLQLVIPPNDQV